MHLSFLLLLWYHFLEVSTIYKNFAFYYDKLMDDINYSSWADYIEKLFSVHKSAPKVILDLGCGTGSFCIEMAERGYEMIGVDLSPEMLSCARKKALEKDLDILYLNQDMTAFELYGTVDAIVCLMDSMNYITYKRDIKKIFKLAHNYLNPSGIFILDFNSRHKLQNVLGNNVFCSSDEDVSYIWQNSYDTSNSLCRFELTFFAKEGANYKRFDEIHYERAYDEIEIKAIALAAGFKFCKVYGEFGLKAPTSKTERIFFVCKKE